MKSRPISEEMESRESGIQIAIRQERKYTVIPHSCIWITALCRVDASIMDRLGQSVGSAMSALPITIYLDGRILLSAEAFRILDETINYRRKAEV